VSNDSQSGERRMPLFIVLTFLVGFAITFLADEVLKLTEWWQRVALYVAAGLTIGGIVLVFSSIRRRTARRR